MNSVQCASAVTISRPRPEFPAARQGNSRGILGGDGFGTPLLH